MYVAVKCYILWRLTRIKTKNVNKFSRVCSTDWKSSLSYCNVNNDIDCLDSIDLPNTILKLLQASLFPFHFASKLVFLSKILAAFPLLVKKGNTIHNCFFRCWRGRHVGSHSSQTDQMIALVCEVKVSGVIRDAWSPTVTFSLSRIPLNNFGVSRLFEINCRSNRRETGTQIGKNRKNQLWSLLSSQAVNENKFSDCDVPEKAAPFNASKLNNCLTTPEHKATIMDSHYLIVTENLLGSSFANLCKTGDNLRRNKIAFVGLAYFEFEIKIVNEFSND